MYRTHLAKGCLTRQWVTWERLLRDFEGFVYEFKAFGFYFTHIKKPTQKSNHIELQKGIKRKDEFYYMQIIYQ